MMLASHVPSFLSLHTHKGDIRSLLVAIVAHVYVLQLFLILFLIRLLFQQAKIAIDTATQLKSDANAALPRAELKLKNAKEALDLSNKALNKAIGDKAYLKAWTQNQLAAALRSVKRAADAAKAVAAKATNDAAATQPGAVVVGDEN